MADAPSHWRTRVAQAGVAAAVVAGCTGALWVVVPTVGADLLTIKTRWHIDQWASGKAPPPGTVAWGNAVNAISEAIALTPADPLLHENLAYLYASRAQTLAAALAPAATTQSYMQQALESYQHSVALRPMSGSTWAGVALAAHWLGRAQPTQPVPSALWPAFDKALAYGQREPQVQATLADIGFARWADLTEPRRSAMQAMLALVQPHAMAPVLAAAQAHGREADLPSTASAAQVSPAGQ